MASVQLPIVSIILGRTFRRISQLWDNAHALNLKNCLLYSSSLISKFLDWMIFYFILYCVTTHTPYTACIACKYGEFDDRSENSDFLLLRQKHPFGELFSEIYFQSSIEFIFLWEIGKLEIQLNQPCKMADGIYPKLCIFNTPAQKEGNLPGFHIHTVCNLHLDRASELKVILK